jgi:hypothetical protein
MSCPRCNAPHLYRDMRGRLREQGSHIVHVCADQLNRKAAA